MGFSCAGANGGCSPDGPPPAGNGSSSAAGSPAEAPLAGNGGCSSDGSPPHGGAPLSSSVGSLVAGPRQLRLAGGSPTVSLRTSMRSRRAGTRMRACAVEHRPVFTRRRKSQSVHSWLCHHGLITRAGMPSSWRPGQGFAMASDGELVVWGASALGVRQAGPRPDGKGGLRAVVVRSSLHEMGPRAGRK